MLTVKYITENRETLEQRLAIKNFRDIELIDRLIETDRRRRELQLQMEQDLAELNSLSKEIGQLYPQGKQEEANKVRERTASLKESSRELKETHGE